MSLYNGSIEPTDWEIEACARVAEVYPPRRAVVLASPSPTTSRSELIDATGVRL